VSSRSCQLDQSMNLVIGVIPASQGPKGNWWSDKTYAVLSRALQRRQHLQRAAVDLRGHLTTARFTVSEGCGLACGIRRFEFPALSAAAEPRASGPPFRVHQKTAPPVQPITRRPPRAWKRQRIRDAGPNTESLSHIYADEHSVKFYAETVCGPGEARAPLLSRAVFEPRPVRLRVMLSHTLLLCTADPGTASSIVPY
jgi:hypothetical protein